MRQIFAAIVMAFMTTSALAVECPTETVEKASDASLVENLRVSNRLANPSEQLFTGCSDSDLEDLGRALKINLKHAQLIHRELDNNKILATIKANYRNALRIVQEEILIRAGGKPAEKASDLGRSLDRSKEAQANEAATNAANTDRINRQQLRDLYEVYQQSIQGLPRRPIAPPAAE